MDMKSGIIIALAALLSLSAKAQESEVMNLRFEVRADYMQEYRNDNKIHDNSGFKGKYLNIRMDGKITEGLTYSFRHRLNRLNSIENFFNATDWITLNYTTGNWGFSAGKQVVGIGGYEYDGAPIDLYFCSEYWNHIACYQFGVSSSYTINDGNDSFLLQFCESPFRTNSLNSANREMFAYNLMWYGKHDWFSTMYSVNMIEYLPGRFINYIALGNQFTFGDFRLQLDLMNRATRASDFLGKDFSIMSELKWQAHECLNIFAKCTYDINRSDAIGDFCVAPGTEMLRIGGGIEYFPIRTYKDLRFHLNCCYTDGTGPAGTALRPEQTIIDAGVTWKVSLLNIKK
jgi:hypothetical protein